MASFATMTLASLRTCWLLHCRAHLPRPSMCIMYGCRTAREITLFARYCLVTPRQKPPKVGFGGFGDGSPPGAVRAWMGLSGRFLALAMHSGPVSHDRRLFRLDPRVYPFGVIRQCFAESQCAHVVIFVARRAG